MQNWIGFLRIYKCAHSYFRKDFASDIEPGQLGAQFCAVQWGCGMLVMQLNTFILISLELIMNSSFFNIRTNLFYKYSMQSSDKDICQKINDNIF